VPGVGLGPPVSWRYRQTLFALFPLKGLLGLWGATNFRRKEKCNLSGAKLQLICVSKAFSAPSDTRYWIVDEEERKMRKSLLGFLPS